MNGLFEQQPSGFAGPDLRADPAKVAEYETVPSVTRRLTELVEQQQQQQLCVPGCSEGVSFIGRSHFHY